MPKDVKTDQEPQQKWYITHRWGLSVAALTLAGFWWKRRRRSAVVLPPVSEDWLMQHEFESGRDQQE
jgi:hypothetical protein